MNKILVEVSVGKLLDKISILEIKKSKINNKKKLKFINDEYKILKIEFKKNIKNSQKVKELFKNLKKINTKLWLIEDNKRKCEKTNNFGKKFIKLSRDVHFLNDKRANIKLKINNYTGSKIKEIKEYSSY